MDKEQITDRIKNSIRSIDSDADVFLFGSRARGNNRPDSDWDILILVDAHKVPDPQWIPHIVWTSIRKNRPDFQKVRQIILQTISKLNLSQQLKLLDFINSIQGKKPNIEPKGLLKFAGTFEAGDLKEMENAIKDCEQIDENEW